MSAIAVIGGTGFVGRSAEQELRRRGHDVHVISAPRFRSQASSAAEIIREARESGRKLRPLLSGFDVVVNAAGVAVATANDRTGLTGANSLLPNALAIAARGAGVARFVHISSSAVQGRTVRLTEHATYQPDSVYSTSKALAEMALLDDRWSGTVILRPTSVHGQGRAVTQRLAALARSPMSFVEAPGTRPTPQVHVESVGRAVAELADLNVTPPPVVLQPSEGFTVATFLHALSLGRRPHEVPPRMVRAALAVGYASARVAGSPVWAQVRRFEMLSRGQEQVPGWLANHGDVVIERERWQALATSCATASRQQ